MVPNFPRLIKRLTLLVERRRLTCTEAPKRLNFSLKRLRLLLVFTEGLFELKPLINVADSTDQDSQENGAKNDQEKRKRDSWNDKPFIALPGENETKHDLTTILDGKNDRHEKGQHPKQCLDPSHFFILPSGLSFSAIDPQRQSEVSDTFFPNIRGRPSSPLSPA
jgi:hypothetical protein